MNDNITTILLVEDEIVIAMAEAAQLKKMGYHTLTAHTAATAVETVDAHPEINLVLMDIDLGRGKPDGTKAAEDILSRRQLPVVFLSSHTEPEVVEKTEKITSYGYIVKNSGMNVLDRSIKMALKLFEAHQEVKKHRAEAEEAYWEMERREERLQHVNRILLSIRNVNQLITQVTDPHTLLDGACRLLIETSGYHNATIVLLKDEVPLEPFYHAGTQQNYPAMVEELRKGNTPPCIQEALREGGIIVMDNTHRGCSGCPLADTEDAPDCIDGGKAGLATRLQYEGVLYGWIMVSLPEKYSKDSDEHRLFAEITGDLSFALHKIDIEIEKNRFNTLLKEKEQLLNGVFESIQDGISVLDKDLTILHTNDIMKRWYGEKMPLEGKKCYTCYQNREAPCVPCPSLRCMESGHTERDEVSGSPGSPVEHIELFSYPMKDPNSGEVTGVVEFVRDITQRKQAEIQLHGSNERLKTNEDRLKKTLIAAQDGTWDWNLVTDEVYFDNRYYEMAGYEVNEFPHRLEEFKKRIHPEDLEAVMEIAQLHLDGEIEQFNVEFRFQKRSGDWLWIQGRGKIVEWDEHGKPLRFVGTHTDITRRKDTEKRLQITSNERETLLKELKHRVKNNFSMIISLLRLKAGAVQAKETRDVLDEMEGRVRVFSELYTQLYREGNVNTIHLENYFRDILDAMSTLPENLDIRTDMEDITAPLKEAGTLGMILTEFVANAVKHSFPANRPGTLYINLGREDSKAFLAVKNDGLPFPEGFTPESSGGLGLTMARAMAEDMGGALDILGGGETGVKVSFVLDSLA